MESIWTPFSCPGPGFLSISTWKSPDHIIKEHKHSNSISLRLTLALEAPRGHVGLTVLSSQSPAHIEPLTCTSCFLCCPSWISGRQGPVD